MVSLFSDLFLFSKKVARYIWVRIKRLKKSFSRTFFMRKSKSKRHRRSRFAIFLLGCNTDKCSDAENLARQLNLIINDFEFSIHVDGTTREAPQALDHIQYLELTQLQRGILKWSSDRQTLVIGDRPNQFRASEKQSLSFMQRLSLQVLSLNVLAEYTLIIPERAAIGSNLVEQITRDWYERKYPLRPR